MGAADLPDDIEDAVRVAVRCVDDEDVHLGVDERGRAFHRVRPDADRSADSQAALLVLRRERVLDPLRDVLDGDEALEPPVRVDHRELLDLVAVEDRLGLGERGADRRCDEVPVRHERRDGLRRVGLEAEVAVREDADEHALVVRDRDTGDAVALHQLERLGDGVRRSERDGLDDHPRLGALDLVDLGDLLSDGEVPVDDPETALARERDREARLGDGVHRRRDQRDVQRDRRRQPRDRRDVVREDARLGGDEEHVVEREPFLAELPLERDEALDLLLPELGLHQVTLAASADVDQATAMPSSSRALATASGRRDVALRLVERESAAAAADAGLGRPPASSSASALRRPISARMKTKSVALRSLDGSATSALGLLVAILSCDSTAASRASAR